ncbi:MFS transporter [Kutzneria buriramensis]|uniref:Putative MFS family arabinose efflux permease n=1 Tax=Kutzneria buriramensis TaxID=1045776 RepID=A0A3E0I939_9PSEU|nr:MFS transporter [Kutzneria buriramensis]REH55046.1 putative MFS family arabinose efflux permease [Kutzneria buriramensis]
MEGTGRAARYRDVFANGEFRALWLAELISTAGDQVARVALSLLVFDRTRSAALAALTFALTMLPALFGPLLAGLADRYPRRTVMICADLCRATLMGIMAIPGVSLPSLFLLLFATQLLGSPSNAARGALLADVLAGDELTVGQSLRAVVGQISQVAGFAAGGFLVTLLTPYGALAVNAASFAASAALIFVGVRTRPAAGSADGEQVSLWTSTHRGARLIWADSQLRTLALMIWMIGLPVAAEGLVVPYLSALAHTPTPDPVYVGWLLAATPVGAIVGALVITRMPPEQRLRLIGPLAALSGLPLFICALEPNLVVSCVLFALSGVAASYMVVAPPAFIQRTPVVGRGQAIGLMSSGAIAAQGIAVALAGVLADRLGPSATIAIAGLAAVVAGIGLTVAWRRSRLHEVGHAA